MKAIYNWLMAGLLLLVGWGVFEIHQSKVDIAQIRQIVADGKDARVDFQRKTEFRLDSMSEQMSDLNLRLAKIELKLENVAKHN